MKLDVTCMRYLTKDDFRVLTAVEQGMRNHELVPVELITSIARLRHGGSYKILSTLLRHKLIAHEQQKYNGYRLSYLGYDILALRTLLSRGVIVAVGSQIGVGKESDIFEAQDENGDEIVLKIHRLGRTSFRSVRKNRDYLENKSKSNWLYMSRLAAVKEYAFMQALYAHDFPTPTPIDHNRHVVVMSRVSGFPMAQIKTGNMEGAEEVFGRCLQILRRLAEHGLVHCDFNEFNLMIDNSGQITMIDFPQMIPSTHPNAAELFTRDLNCLVKFFAMKMRYVASEEERSLQLSDIAEAESAGEIYGTVQKTQGLGSAEDSALIEFLMHSSEMQDLDYQAATVVTPVQDAEKCESTGDIDAADQEADTCWRALKGQSLNQQPEEEGDKKVSGLAEESAGYSSGAANCSDNESEGSQGEDEGEDAPVTEAELQQAAIRNKIRRVRSKHHNKQGSRNATKKRNKYGKVERMNLKYEA
mmetsp:Transcript_24811/g.36594  ORF Transcript_24811/g.36594 Transcript_24811/m.36594 type:complete len:473 (+) Transcript_24811:88-1506(+)